MISITEYAVEEDTTISSLNDISKWRIEFLTIVILTASLSGIFYLLQNFVFENYIESSREDTRLFIRMTAFYVIPAIWFTYRWGGNFNSLGLFPKKGYITLNILLGVLLYTIASLVFVRNEIFFGGWKNLSWHHAWINFVLVGLMASITDFWTRGFILFELSRKTSDANAILWQNITWFVIHIYEIDALEPYIGILGGILLTLFLGIGGDIVALKTRSIFGLLLGHISLNLMILLAAKETFVLI